MPPSSRLEWKIVPKQDSEKLKLIFFSKDNLKFCTLELSFEKNIPIMLSDEKGTLFDQSLGHFIPAVGYPAPCRVVDFSNLDNQGSFDIVKKAAGQTFRKKYNIIKTIVSIEKARQNNWIKDDIFSDRDETFHFLLYSIFDDRDEFLFKQLWADSDSWWVYEETPGSRSWRK